LAAGIVRSLLTIIGIWANELEEKHIHHQTINNLRSSRNCLLLPFKFTAAKVAS
jgi:hypothetical protein